MVPYEIDDKDLIHSIDQLDLIVQVYRDCPDQWQQILIDFIKKLRNVRSFKLMIVSKVSGKHEFGSKRTRELGRAVSKNRQLETLSIQFIPGIDYSYQNDFFAGLCEDCPLLLEFVSYEGYEMRYMNRLETLQKVWKLLILKLPSGIGPIQLIRSFASEGIKSTSSSSHYYF